MPAAADVRTAFLKAALWHGGLTRANEMLAAHPDLAKSDIHTAAVLGDDETVRRLIAADKASVTAKGRADVLALFERRGFALTFDGVDRLIAACALDDGSTIRFIATAEPALVSELVAMGGELMGRFTSNWNAKGVRHLLDLGVSPTAPFTDGDGYWAIPENSLPIHVAAWREQPEILRLLIERGSPVNVRDAKGRTPLMLAVASCVDSYWTERRSPASTKALLDAGANVEGVPFPSGYAEVDKLLGPHFRA